MELESSKRECMNLKEALRASSSQIARLQKEQEDIVQKVVTTVYNVSNSLMDRGLWQDAKYMLIELHPIWSYATTAQMHDLSLEQSRMNKMILCILRDDPNMHILLARLGMLYMVMQ
jgi:hypothetical protein